MLAPGATKLMMSRVAKAKALRDRAGSPPEAVDDRQSTTT
jgi:hypothetical protein